MQADVERHEDGRKKRLALAQILTVRVPLNALEAEFMSAEKALLDVQRDHFLAREWAIELRDRWVRLRSYCIVSPAFDSAARRTRAR